jgi:cysteine desulfurase
VESARRDLASLIGALATEVIFTSGATEANNMALATLAAGHDGAIMISAVEHPSVLAAAARLEAQGRQVVRLPVDPGGHLPGTQEVVALGRQHGVRALSLMLANNETGHVYPIAELAAAARQEGWLVHTDATQAVGKLPVNVEALGVDMLSLSGHKLYGPVGTGALWLRSEVELCPLVVGGHQERGRRGGTENVMAIAGLGAAVQVARRSLDGEAQRLRGLREALWEGIAALEPTAARQTPADPAKALPNTLNVRFGQVDGETLLINLDLEGISVSAGSACTAGSMEPSHVILAMGVPAQEARGSVRMSLGRDTTAQDVELLLARLPGVLARTRGAAW